MTPAPLILSPVGAVLGSFVATSALRRASACETWPTRSRCDHCGHALGYAKTVPIYTFLQLGGTARCCGGRIDPSHFVGEIIGAAALPTAFMLLDPVAAAVAALLGFVLLAIAVLDWRSLYIPDAWTAMVVAAAAVMLTLHRERVIACASAAAITFCCLVVLSQGFRIRSGRVGLGFGDVKLISALALWIGPAIAPAMALACFLGLGLAALGLTREGRVPFAPAIASACWSAGIVMERGLWSLFI